MVSLFKKYFTGNRSYSIDGMPIVITYGTKFSKRDVPLPAQHFGGWLSFYDSVWFAAFVEPSSTRQMLWRRYISAGFKQFESEFKLNVIVSSCISFTPFVMMTPLLMSVDMDPSFRSHRFLCTGGRVGRLLASIHGVHAVCGTVPGLWRCHGTCCVAVLSTAGSRAFRYQPSALLATQQTVSPAAQLYRLSAPPAIREVTSVPTTTLPPQCHRSSPVLNQRGRPRTFPPAICQFQTAATTAFPHLALFTVVCAVTNWTPAFFVKCDATLVSVLRKTAS